MQTIQTETKAQVIIQRPWGIVGAADEGGGRVRLVAVSTQGEELDEIVDEDGFLLWLDGGTVEECFPGMPVPSQQILVVGEWSPLSSGGE